jgi:hypothetical protein
VFFKNHLTKFFDLFLYFRYEAGGAGTVFIKDSRKNKRNLIVNNNNVGAPLSDDITNIVNDGGRSWITPEIGTRVVEYDQVDLRGKAQLAVLTNPPGSALQGIIRGFTGDRSGILHIQGNQTLRMTSNSADAGDQKLPLGVNVYSKGDVQLPESMFIDGIKVIVAGSISGAHNVTVGNKGKLVLR